MKNFRWTILAAVLLASTGAAQAQVPAPPQPIGGSGMSSPTSSSLSPSGSGSMGSAGATNTNEDSGRINSAVGNTSFSSTERTTVTTTSGIGPDGVEIGLDSTGGDAMLADTGGEPIIMSLLGLSVAAGAFFMRRRVSA